MAGYTFRTMLNRPTLPMPFALRPTAMLRIVGILLVLGGIAGCQQKEIPPRFTLGETIAEDDFQRDEIGPKWQTNHAGWSIVKGWVHSDAARNEGLYLSAELPSDVFIEFDARSEPKPGVKTFPGDIKCDVFCEKPARQTCHKNHLCSTGYTIINGGWKNELDIIARRDEHGDDRKHRSTTASSKVKPSVVYHWAIARIDSKVYWFRDGELQMTYEDDDAIRGGFFGFNNWEANVYFDNFRVRKVLSSGS